MQSQSSYEYNREYCINIDLTKPKVEHQELEKMTKAWSCGDQIFEKVFFDEFDRVCVEIESRRGNAGRSWENVSREWIQICETLKNGELPQRWLTTALELIEEEKSDE